MRLRVLAQGRADKAHHLAVVRIRPQSNDFVVVFVVAVAHFALPGRTSATAAATVWPCVSACCSPWYLGNSTRKNSAAITAAISQVIGCGSTQHNTSKAAKIKPAIIRVIKLIVRAQASATVSRA